MIYLKQKNYDGLRCNNLEYASRGNRNFDSKVIDIAKFVINEPAINLS